jgi:hypothetical protein
MVHSSSSSVKLLVSANNLFRTISWTWVGFETDQKSVFQAKRPAEESDEQLHSEQIISAMTLHTWFNVAVNEVLDVEILEATDHLIHQHKHGLDCEVATTEIE